MTEVMEDNAMVLDADYDDEEESVPETAEEAVPEAEGSEEPAEETNDAHALAVLEGLLFITGDEGITLEQASEALGIDQERCEKLLDDLTKYYLNDDRGIEIARFGGVYRFLSKAFVHEYAQKLFLLGKSARLSQAALETLAIIAYKQPVTRVEIEEIRGVGADMMLKKLQARNLIREDGRSDAPGRPILYSVTEEFMDAFQLVSLEELPDLPEFDSDAEGTELFGNIQ